MNQFSLATLAAAGEEAAQNATNWLPLTALLVSVIAAIFSGVALWRTHFSKGEVVFAPGKAGISVTHWANEGRSWYTPDIVITSSIANTGARPIIVQGLRVRVDYPELPIPNAHEIWDFNVELDTTTELRSGPGRSALKAKSGTGTPWVVLSKANIDKRFVCWSRWEKPVVQSMIFTLEAKTTRSQRWIVVESWKFKMTPQEWVGMTSKGTIVWVSPEGQKAARYVRATNPRDLHKYTGPSEPLPDKAPHPSPSYVVHDSAPDRGIAG
ncbi:hypothetical protein LXM50_12980 [Microbacterium sp. Au-Mic1]|uniref:hypothetical protein n=1 Tax=Microbacterium sp. Au-Mic1 TaxID=2906457 RepID=UPI001E2A1FB5|nr:hypothetical protein [Microbacterium sp. Au-Mic1]MCE4026886.1 hypothetical protein [Microbacterium sp. Au-Mic1]